MEVYRATGRRKSAIARVRLIPGKGDININKSNLMEYFKRESLKTFVIKPFEYLDIAGQYDVIANIRGVGLSGQAGALQLGISRCLAQINEDFRVKLRKDLYLTRDARVVERKKYGQKGARKRFQFSKR